MPLSRTFFVMSACLSALLASPVYAEPVVSSGGYARGFLSFMAALFILFPFLTIGLAFVLNTLPYLFESLPARYQKMMRVPFAVGFFLATMSSLYVAKELVVTVFERGSFRSFPDFLQMMGVIGFGLAFFRALHLLNIVAKDA